MHFNLKDKITAVKRLVSLFSTPCLHAIQFGRGGRLRFCFLYYTVHLHSFLCVYYYLPPCCLFPVQPLSLSNNLLNMLPEERIRAHGYAPCIRHKTHILFTLKKLVSTGSPREQSTANRSMNPLCHLANCASLQLGTM